MTEGRALVLVVHRRQQAIIGIRSLWSRLEAQQNLLAKVAHTLRLTEFIYIYLVNFDGLAKMTSR